MTECREYIFRSSENVFNFFLSMRVARLASHKAECEQQLRDSVQPAEGVVVFLCLSLLELNADTHFAHLQTSEKKKP